MPEPTKMLHANADKTALVPEDHPDARYIVNPNDPGEFRELVEGHQKAQAPVEDKSAEKKESKTSSAGFEPNPPGSPEREKRGK